MRRFIFVSSFGCIATNARSHRLKNPGKERGAPLPSACGRLYVPTVEFRLLGPLEVERDGDAISLGGPKQRAALAHLLLRSNTLVPADRLIDEVWGTGMGRPRRRGTSSRAISRVFAARSVRTG